MFEDKASAVEEYGQGFLARGLGADQCESCGVCEPMCPRNIPIPERLQEAHGYLTSPIGGAACQRGP
jgi:predicted aldo/keto reductase-like oxidoreductase